MSGKKTIIREVLENGLFAVLHNGQFWDKNGNSFGIRLWMAHDLCESKVQAENQLKHLRETGVFGSNEGQLISLAIKMEAVAA